jgi:hypothetical protein
MSMVARICSSKHWGRSGGKIAWTQGSKSRLGNIARPHLKNNKLWKSLKLTKIHILQISDDNMYWECANCIDFIKHEHWTWLNIIYITLVEAAEVFKIIIQVLYLMSQKYIFDCLHCGQSVSVLWKNPHYPVFFINHLTCHNNFPQKCLFTFQSYKWHYT